MYKQVLKKETVILALSSIILGVITGGIALLLNLILDFVEHTFSSFIETARQPYAMHISATQRVLSVLVGGIIAAFVWYLVRNKMKAPISIGAAMEGKSMPFISMILNTIIQIFYVGAGGSVGRELAPREAGALFAQKWEELLTKWGISSLTKEDQKLLIAAAAGAGFAGVYIAPITGMLFCTEILLKKINTKVVAVSLSMSIVSMLTSAFVKGFKPYYLVGKSDFAPEFLIYVIPIAILCGIVGAIFRKAFQWAEAHKETSNKILIKLPLMALATGLVAIVFPEISGNGRALAQASLNNSTQTMIMFFVLGALAKGIVTVLTLHAGASGGTLTPSIAIGAAIGSIFGTIFLTSASTIPFWQCSLLGGAALLAASQQAPLMALFMIMEVSHLNYSAFLPFGTGVIIALVVSKLVLKLLDTKTAK